MNTETLVVLVTGGSGGLGGVIVSKFCKKNFKVIVNYLHADPKTAKFCRSFGEQVLPIAADIRKYNDVLHMANNISRQLSRVDVIINNAGIKRDSLLIKQTEDDWDNIIDTNLKGAYNIIKAFSPLMTNGGHIINISSYSGIKGRKGQSAYSASKSALIGLTKSAAAELAQYAIKVNAVIPGYMPVGMGLDAISAMQNAKNESLLGRLSEPEEVGEFILYLITTKNITGQIFSLESRIVY